MNIKKPSDYFTEIDATVKSFQDKNTHIYWKVDATNTLLQLSNTIVLTKYHNELLKLLKSPTVTPPQFAAYRKSIEGVKELDRYSRLSDFFATTFKTLQENKGDKDPDDYLALVIETNHELNEMIFKISHIVFVFEKYPFKKLFRLVKGRNANNALFKKIK